MMKCETKGCRKPAGKSLRICWSCRIALYKQKHPVRYAYQVLKNNARRRGKAFELTLEQFEKFCYETEVLHGRGRTSTSFHIDRIDDSKGYSMDNIQVLTNTQNVKKENRRRKIIKFNHQHQFGFMVEASAHHLTANNDVPF